MGKIHYTKVFAYGSLTNQKFVERLLGKKVKMLPAKLKGYRKIKLPGRKYPVAIKEENSLIKGKTSS